LAALPAAFLGSHSKESSLIRKEQYGILLDDSRHVSQNVGDISVLGGFSEERLNEC
jgi:hypothetical protein